MKATPRVYDSVNPRIYYFNKYPGGIDAAGPGTVF